ncbi:MAG TPA: aminomethyltransferase beta-barrel domain-containing protein, partial [Candidatus Limnocylindrales bacterium]|nr:aminomethyltransferase beta-barrel domain-containing protein [Candidatus Limnocylindrales bacterium]
IDVDGTRVGDHRGAAAYTIGQRQGLGVALGEPRFVNTIDAATNIVTLGRREDLYRQDFEVESVTFVDGEPPDGGDDFSADVRIRHRAEPLPATVTRGATDRTWSVHLERPAWAPAPGQAAVFYRGDEVIGGGRIDA